MDISEQNTKSTGAAARSWVTWGIALVWFINGLYCKVLDRVPRHQEIVAAFTGESYARMATLLIGIAEIIMAFWVLSRYRYRFNALFQIGIVLLMNILETILVPELLLWGRWNLVFALAFTGIVYLNAFTIKTCPEKRSLI